VLMVVATLRRQLTRSGRPVPRRWVTGRGGLTGEDPRDMALHELRKAAKRGRYAAGSVASR
jgi:CHAD domain-containing protein